MEDLGHLLQRSDPLRHETVRHDAERARIRSAVLAATAESAHPPGVARLTRFSRLVPVLAMGLLIAVAAVYVTGALRLTPLMAQVRFELRLAEDRPAPGLLVDEVQNSKRLLYLHPETVVGNDDVAQTWVVEAAAGEYAVGVQFLPEGAARLKQASEAHTGRPMAVLIDGRVVMAPTVRSPMSDSATISGSFNRAEAERIASGMTNR